MLLETFSSKLGAWTLQSWPINMNLCLVLSFVLAFALIYIIYIDEVTFNYTIIFKDRVP